MGMRTWLALGALAALVGCATAPQAPIALEANKLNASSGKVGVAMSAVPAADTHLPGAGCLLCLAAASLANSSLTTHTKTLSAKDLSSIQSDVVDALRRKGVEVVVIVDPIKLEDLPKATSTAPNTARDPARNIAAPSSLQSEPLQAEQSSCRTKCFENRPMAVTIVRIF